MKADRQTKLLLALIALALVLNALNPWLQPPTAIAAQAPPADLPMMEVHLRNLEETVLRIAEYVERDSQFPSRCSWTLIDDGGTPRIGTNGRVDLSPEWQRLSREGWMLKAVHDDEFIFERCFDPFTSVFR